MNKIGGDMLSVEGVGAGEGEWRRWWCFGVKIQLIA